MSEFNKLALAYHEKFPPGKLEIRATKPLATQHDLALAYSPGVAAACEEIVARPESVRTLTARGNLVAVVTNGTAVLGLGNIGPLASKPVMEGKAVLFKKFAGVDVFDLEINENDSDKLVDIIAALEPTFGGINLEDIKAPECFKIEKELRKRLNIPVFHDDQHGTAIIASAAIVNSLRLQNKKIEEVKMVVSGAGAAAIACLDLLVLLGLKRENIIVCDRVGVIHDGREGLDEYKDKYKSNTAARSMDEALVGADVFMGLSAAGLLKADMVDKMVEAPIILALANPTPEIMPEEALKVRPKAIIATGRSDYPNQVNNVLCFPYIFRGALDVGATTINEEMKVACVKAISDLTTEASPEEVLQAYGRDNNLNFGPDYIIPKPFDPRLILRLAPAVAKAAMDSGVATRPIEDFDLYTEQLSQFVFPSFFVMKPVFAKAKRTSKRLVFAEGEDRRVLQAAQYLADEKLARPIVIGRPEVIENRILELGLAMRAGIELEIVNINDDKRYKEYWTGYHALCSRKGVTPENAKTLVRTDPTVVASMMLHQNDADAMICGANGRFTAHVDVIDDVLGKRADVKSFSTLYALILPHDTLFICDSHINENPTAEQIVEMTKLAAAKIKQFGMIPKVAFLSHSSFGSHDNESAKKMQKAVSLMDQENVDFDYEGEMHGSAAIDQAIRSRYIDGSRITSKANLLIMPNLDAAQISTGLLRTLSEGINIGPMLMGSEYPAHVVTNSVTVRSLINIAALAVNDAVEKDAS